MAKRASLRASDDDRERVAERLRQAATEGRIVAHELEERLATALRARTYGELDDVVSDLPTSSGGSRRSSSRVRTLVAEQPVATVAILVALTLVAFVLAVVVLAGLLAFSGVWVLLGLMVLIRRGGGPGRHPHRPYPHRRPYRSW